MKNILHSFSFLNLFCLSLLFYSNTCFSQVTDWTKNWTSNVQIHKHHFQPGFGHVLVGVFNNTVDFDPGPSVQNSVSTNSALFILKLDTTGGFEWVKTMESDSVTANIIKVGDLKINAQNDICLNGFATSIDLDPSASVAQFSSTTYQTPVFLAKYSSTGNFLWHQTVNLPFNENKMEVDNFGNVFIHTIATAGPVSITVGADNVSTTGQSNESVIAKYSNTGVGLWVKKIRSNLPSNPYNYARARTMTVANDGSIFLAGEFKDSIDFDPSSTSDFYLNGFPQSSSLNYNSFFLLKLDANGDFVFAKKQNDTYDTGITKDLFSNSNGETYVIGKTTLGTSWNQPHNYIRRYDSNGDSLWTKYIEGNGVDFENLAMDQNENLYITGNFIINSFLLDPVISSSEIFNLPAASGGSGFVARYDSLGNYIWVNQEFDSLDGSIWGQTNFTNVSVDSVGTVYILNTPNSGVLKINQDSCALNFSIGVGSVQQITCGQNGQINITTTGGIGPISYLWSTGDTTNFTIASTPAVIYTVVATSQNGCSSTINIQMNGPSNSAGFDLDASLVAPVTITPGQPSNLSLHVKNLHCSPVSGSVFLVLDTLTSFVNATIPPNSISGDTLLWNFYNMTFDSNNIIIQVHVLTDTLAQLGNLAHYVLNASPYPNDVDITNNQVIAFSLTQTSYDPNDIAVYPKGRCNESFIAPDQKLKYTVRFQNTGTSSAININILDSLDSNLQSGTIRVISSSHDMYTQRYLNHNVVNFVFDDINLPDSNSNEPESHGYVVFEIEPLPWLSDGTEIENNVGIYFDYNVPVYTNTVLNTIYTGNLEDLECDFLAIEELDKTTKLMVYPNPVKHKVHILNPDQFGNNVMFHIIDINGRIVQQTSLVGSSIDVRELNSGLYFIKVNNAKGSGMSRFIKQ